MLPGVTVPRSLADLLAVFRPCFTAPTFPTFVGLLVGLIAPTRRSNRYAEMLTGVRAAGRIWHHSRAHRLFTNARWSGDALGLVLADLIVAQLLPPDSALTIAVDDTFVRTGPGKEVFGVARLMTGAHQRQRRRDRNPSGSAIAWVVAGDRGAAVVSVSPGVPSGAGPTVATPAHRKDRTRPTAGRVDRRPLPRPDRARGRRRRLRRGTPTRCGRPDHLDQPLEGHLGAARTAPAPHRTLRPTPHPRRPAGHPGRCRRPRAEGEHLADHSGPPVRPHRHRADHRTDLSPVRIVSHSHRASDSGVRRQNPDSGR